jgi:tetratricopeptide (TPR) repeat protein
MSPALKPTLVQAMIGAQRERGAGVFDIVAADTRTRLYVAKGRIVFADGGAPTDTLGRVLLREGKLTTEQYTAVIERMTRQSTPSEQMRFGEVVVELGFLRPGEVHEALATQVRHKAIACLSAEVLNWKFEQVSARVLASVAHFPSPVEPLLLASTKLFEAERLDRILEMAQERSVRLLSDPEPISAAFELNGAETRLVQSIDGQRSCWQLVELDRTGAGRARPLLAALVLGGMAELCNRSATALTTAASRAWLTTTPVVEAEKLRTPDVDAAAPPRTRVEPPKPEAKPEPTVAATSAHPVTDTRVARLKGEESFQIGKVHLANGALSSALGCLRQAVDLCPDALEFALYAKWAEFLAANDESRPGARQALRPLALRAVKQSPNLAFGYFVLGWSAFLDNNGPRATRCFRHALELDAKLVDAERYLRILQLRGGKPSVAEVAESKPPAREPPSTSSSLAVLAAKVEETLASLRGAKERTREVRKRTETETETETDTETEQDRARAIPDRGRTGS